MSDATLHTVNGEPTLRFERRLRHSPAKVWRAVTDPAELAHWFPAAVEAQLRPGAPMRFTFPEEAVVDSEWDGEVLEVDEPRVFMFRWSADVLRIELIPDGDGCRLVFTQTIGGGQVGLLGAGRTAAGWDTCLDTLVARLDGTSAPEGSDWLPPMEHYIRKFGLGEGTATTTGDGWELRFARDLVWKPPADVWQVLTDGTVGEKPPVQATNGIVPAGRVVRAQAPKVLAYEWLHDGEPAGTVRWELFSDQELGVRVELTQTVPAHLGEVLPQAMAAWHLQLELFFAAIMGEVRCAWSADRITELTKHYAGATRSSA
ncbi:SRPBCC family protein [Actinophytocola glycyrrhizae]|uniref:SRPBCC family protein n=1 Tax=Actinophytocola glycyrrhizae TaxID=2044873 RepID=A0ABV9SB66_9PSEU